MSLFGFGVRVMLALECVWKNSLLLMDIKGQLFGREPMEGVRKRLERRTETSTELNQDLLAR
jgi:hypothetical protein